MSHETTTSVYDPYQFETRTAGLAILGHQDSCNNIYIPTQGKESELIVTGYDKTVGGDFNYWRYHFTFRSHHETS